MVDPLKITNEIWRKWDDTKSYPMSWHELRIKVEEHLAAGKDPHTIGAESNPTLKDLFTGRTLEGYVEAAKAKTLDTFTPRGKYAIFYFENKEERTRANTILQRNNLHYDYGPNVSLENIEDPDAALEILASEGFDTSKIVVERE